MGHGWLFANPASTRRPAGFSPGPLTTPFSHHGENKSDKFPPADLLAIASTRVSTIATDIPQRGPVLSLPASHLIGRLLEHGIDGTSRVAKGGYLGRTTLNPRKDCRCRDLSSTSKTHPNRWIHPFFLLPKPPSDMDDTRRTIFLQCSR